MFLAVSTSTAYSLLGIGLGLLVLAIICTIFFISFKNKKRAEKDSFKLVTGNNKIFRFWQYYAIIFVMVTCYLGALVLLPIAIQTLI